MSHKVKERLSSTYKCDVTLLNEGYTISVFTYEIHFMHKATKIQMNLVICSRS